MIGATNVAWAQDAPSSGSSATVIAVWVIAFIASIVALIQAFLFYKTMMAADEGNEKMVEIAGHVRQGANAYLKQQYIVVAGFFVVIAVLLSLAAFGLEVQSKFVPFAFLTGGF
ncbi:MAG: sodium/proton-translocating pyrophosphatase, partial [Pirellulaceae bacterium]